jgi:putative hemolysin
VGYITRLNNSAAGASKEVPGSLESAPKKGRSAMNDELHPTHHRAGYSLAIAAPEEVREVQLLRRHVFTAEFGSHLPTLVDELDADEFDEHCDHLIVRENSSRAIVATYRMMTPGCASIVGSRFGDRVFDLGSLRHIAADLVETGRSCVHPDHRNGAVISLIWGGIGQYLSRTGYRHLGGSAWVSLDDNGDAAAGIWEAVRDKHLAPREFRVVPRVPLLSGDAAPGKRVAVPPLLRGYLRLGSWICGEPAYDPDAKVASFYVLLSLEHMNARYRRHFFGDSGPVRHH